MEKTEKKFNKYKPVKCTACRKAIIDIDVCIENEDYEFTDKAKSKIYVYCPKCGVETEVKL